MYRLSTLIGMALLLWLVSCAQQAQYDPLPEGPEPDWLSVLHPAPGQTLSLADYRSAGYETYRGQLGLSAAPDAVCVAIEAVYLIASGDHWELADILERTAIFVDDEAQEISGEILDGIVYNALRDRAGNELASVGGPYAFCVAAGLVAGLHRAEVRFTLSNGEIEQFAWTFTITKGPAPTPTPLPIAEVVDSTGELPHFLRAIFPPPGGTVPVASDTTLWRELEAIWPGLSSEQQDNFCLAIYTERLPAFGVFPNSNRRWNDRIKMAVDGNTLSGSQATYTRRYWDEERISATCYKVPYKMGSHTATILVEPFEQPVTIYSWAFNVVQ